jgi:hypothetical protein
MGNACFAKTTELCTEKVGRSAKLFSQLSGRRAGGEMLTVDLYGILCETVYLGTHRSENVEKNFYIAYGRNVVDNTRLLVKNTCTDNRECGILHAVDRYVSVKGTTAIDDDLLHTYLRVFSRHIAVIF